MVKEASVILLASRLGRSKKRQAISISRRLAATAAIVETSISRAEFEKGYSNRSVTAVAIPANAMTPVRMPVWRKR
ncbi:hypothetical protein D3C80_1851140 [compost metagenome]